MTFTGTVTDSITNASASLTVPLAIGPTLGVCAGNSNVAGIGAFVTATGASVSLAEIFLPDDSGWAGLAQPGLDYWLAPWVGAGYHMVFAVPMITSSDGKNPAGTLASGATGAYNATFASMGALLVADGFANAYLRLGWEFNGSGYWWNVANATDAANFATFFQQIVTTLRAVPGAQFKFVWSLAGNPWVTYPLVDAYPGNTYVDFIGMDVYDESYSSSLFPPSGDPNSVSTPAQSNTNFATLETQTYGLNWLVSFAEQQGKPIVIPEWAVEHSSHGLGDDPTFINNMHAWMLANNIAWSVYFNFDETGYSWAITDGDFPNALAAFKSAFG